MTLARVKIKVQFYDSLFIKLCKKKEVNNGALKFILLAEFYEQCLWKEIKIYVVCTGVENMESHWWETFYFFVIKTSIETMELKKLFHVEFMKSWKTCLAKNFNFNLKLEVESTQHTNMEYVRIQNVKIMFDVILHPRDSEFSSKRCSN